MDSYTRALMFAGSAALLVGCGSSPDTDDKKQAVGNKTFFIIDDGIVGVEEEHNAVSSFLYNGDPKSTEGDERRSVYYLNEGAVILTNSAELSGSKEGACPRKIKDMLDYEKEEFAQAVEFYTAKVGVRPQVSPGTPPVQPDLSAPPMPTAQDSSSTFQGAFRGRRLQ